MRRLYREANRRGKATPWPWAVWPAVLVGVPVGLVAGLLNISWLGVLVITLAVEVLGFLWIWQVGGEFLRRERNR